MILHPTTPAALHPKPIHIVLMRVALLLRHITTAIPQGARQRRLISIAPSARRLTSIPIALMRVAALLMHILIALIAAVLRLKPIPIVIAVV